MPRTPNYDKFPTLDVPGHQGWDGWTAVGAELARAAQGKRVVTVEHYPGVLDAEVKPALVSALKPALVIDTADLLKPVAEVEALCKPYQFDDPLFGRMNGLEIRDFFDPAKLAAAQAQVAGSTGQVLVQGVGATLVHGGELLVYADLARWEIQLRMRAGKVSNLGAANAGAKFPYLYKRGFYIDWRAADRLKKPLLARYDYVLDTNLAGQPKLATGDAVRTGLRHAAHRPFRVVPFFDPAPWGGQWMKDVCDLDRSKANYGWCFDCVPEENSLFLSFGGVRLELPSIDLVFAHPRELLGDPVHGRFGAEFPIRFDFLDTIKGGHLSLQVHPLTEYIQDRFGMTYTQDESYYILDADPGATVYLGLKEDVDPRAMIDELNAAQTGGPAFDAEKHVNLWPAKKHDHFLIPGGTVHCSGSGAMVLEISATPYNFTFKLWDWGRLGLDGKPRPISINHGQHVIQWDRTTDWTRRNLVNAVEPVASGDGWREERTGLHQREFIETRRHWFTKAVAHSAGGKEFGGVRVINLIEGEDAIVESPTGAWPAYTVHYAETFIIPAAAGDYVIKPGPNSQGRECATLTAWVRC